MKQIIFVHLLNDYSGSPKVLSQVIHAVKLQGGDPILYTGKGSKGFLSGMVEKQYSYYYKRSENRFATLFSFSLSQIILFIKLLKYVNKDVIIYVNTMLPFGAALAGFLIRKPVYYHVHEISMTPLSLKRFLRAIIQLTAKKVFYVSEAVKNSEPFKDKESYVIYNALPRAFVDQATNHTYQYRYKNRFHVLMIGSLKTYKGILEFLQIAQKLKEYSFINFTLVLNADGNEVLEFETKASIPNNVKLVPRQQNVIPFYKRANLVMNLSRVNECVETFGLTIIEAMAFGIPVIVPPVGGPSEIVTDDIQGYLITSYEIDRIAQKIQELSMDEEKCNSISKNALKRAKEFSETEFDHKIISAIDA